MSELPDTAALVQLHIENLCDFDDRGRVRAPRGSDRPARRFAMVLTKDEHRWFLRDDLDEGLAARLQELAASEPVTGELPDWPVHTAEYRELLGVAAPTEEHEHCGPAYVLPAIEFESNPAIELTEEHRPLIERHLPGWGGAEFEPSLPMGGVIEDGAVVSLCGNARRRSAAVEAGVETAEAYRGRGHARKATAVWASALRRDGMLPLYSTSWDNIASRRVATSLGAVRYATNFNLR
jgi:RimJ/RimL family protein N-acetyltransferase